MFRWLTRATTWFTDLRSLKCSGKYRKHCTHYKGTFNQRDPNSDCHSYVQMDKWMCCRCDYTGYTRTYSAFAKR